MSIFVRLLGCVLLAFGLAGCGPADDPIATRPAGALRIATQNVHYIDLNKPTGSWSVADWEERKPALDQAVGELDADIVAFQEMESFAGGNDGSINLARDWLLQRHPQYAAGANGDWRSFPSTQPIFYRKDRFALIEQGWFFFSDTPDIIYARTYDGSYPAFASWVRLQDNVSGKVIAVFNVHFEYKNGSNRLKSAALVAERTAPLIANGDRVVLLGDMNARAGSKTLGILEDAGFDFLPTSGSTYHLNAGLNLFGAIDHLATAGAVLATTPPQVQRRRVRGRWPSDHYAVVGDFHLQ